MINTKSLLVSLLLLSFCATIASAQEKQLTINEAYTLAEQNYPLTKQRELISKTTEYTIDNIQKGYLPQVTLIGQATYQSDVTEIPIKVPGVTALSKDQYKVYGELNQVLYDGGAIKNQKELQKANALIEQRKLDANLYQLKERVQQLFFGALLIDEQLKQNELLVNDIEIGVKKINALIANGTALKSNADVLNADLLRNKQRLVELRASRNAYTSMLSLFIGKTINKETKLILPQALNLNQQLNRPELEIYQQQVKALGVQEKLLTTKTLPKFSFFLQGGAGRPALNMLSNSFDGYYIGGLRLSWSPSTLYTLKKERELINLNRNSIDIQKETFLFNTNLTLSQQNAETNKYQELLATDEEIISLRSKIKTAAIAQLENGVINSSDFIREANAENLARQNKSLHQIQFLLSQYNQQSTSGNL
jgi:outer membrane protein TolC